jgi:hypothetical protein
VAGALATLAANWAAGACQPVSEMPGMSSCEQTDLGMRLGLAGPGRVIASRVSAQETGSTVPSRMWSAMCPGQTYCSVIQR